MTSVTLSRFLKTISSLAIAIILFLEASVSPALAQGIFPPLHQPLIGKIGLFQGKFTAAKANNVDPAEVRAIAITVCRN